jgi:hypothetical protein
MGVAGESALGWVAPGVLLALIAWWWYALAVQGSPEDWAFDFRQFWQGVNGVVNGVSPYPCAPLPAIIVASSATPRSAIGLISR